MTIRHHKQNFTKILTNMRSFFLREVMHFTVWLHHAIKFNINLKVFCLVYWKSSIWKSAYQPKASIDLQDTIIGTKNCWSSWLINSNAPSTWVSLSSSVSSTMFPAAGRPPINSCIASKYSQTDGPFPKNNQEQSELKMVITSTGESMLHVALELGR